MNGKPAYVDTSAFLKLVVAEPETKELRRYLLRWPARASAAVVRTETIRALRRLGLDDRVGGARRLLQRMRLIRLDDVLLDRAAELDPRHLRSLDAIHLAAALALGTDLGVMITYDERMRAAARERGLAVASPS